MWLIVDMSRDAGRVFCFSGRDWEGVSRNLLSLVKLHQRIYIWTLKKKFNNGFTNRHCLHYAIIKAYKARESMYFFFRNVQNEIFKILKMFKYNMKFTRVAWWIQKKATVAKTPHSWYSYFVPVAGH